MFITPDGSDRSFTVTEFCGNKAVAVGPSPGGHGLAEARSYASIGRHLFACGVPVPEILDFDEASGVVHAAFLPGHHLEEEVKGLKERGDEAGIERLYGRVLRELAWMQVRGGLGFDPAWCWDTPVYDAHFAFEREACYFLSSFAKGYAGLSDLDEVRSELKGLSSLVDAVTCGHFFLHRDFQSRNVLVDGEKIGIVDFQGGRIGPLHYDVASLLFDPYAALPSKMHGSLIEAYLDELARLGVPADPGRFRKDLEVLGVFRLLQALGAYAHLALVKGKERFRTYIPAALASLYELCTGLNTYEISGLRRLLDRLLGLYA